MDTVDELLVDEVVFGEAVEVNTMELFHLADLKVKRSLCCKQDTVLPVIEPCQSTLHLVFRGMLANILELHHEHHTEALTLSKNDFNLTYSK